MKDKGILFIGDVMNENQREELVRSLAEFEAKNKNSGYRTKTNWSVELFISRGFFEDLRADMKGIDNIQFSNKIHTIENELTRFRYDVIIGVDKSGGKIE